MGVQQIFFIALFSQSLNLSFTPNSAGPREIYTKQLFLWSPKVILGWVWWLPPVIPAPWEAEVGGLLKPRSLWPASAKWWDPVSTKKKIISQAWWYTTVVPPTQEAEMGASLEPRGWSLQWAMITPLYSSLGNRAGFCLKKNQKHKKTKNSRGDFYGIMMA